MSDVVIYEVRDRVARITLNRPEKRNALSVALTEAFDAAVRRALGDDGVRVLLLTHTGPTYCAGVDLAVGEGTPEAGATDLLPTTFHLHYESVVQQLWNAPKPVVGMLLGGAYGAGVGMVAVCDLVVAAEGATFAISELRWGRIPSRVPVIFGQKGIMGPARPYMLTGARFYAATALAMGLVQRVVPAAQVEAATAEYLAELLLCAPQATADFKAHLRAIADVPAAEAMRRGTEIIAGMFLTPSAEMREGKAAFREKRKPAWVG